jgi:hypothetical protein
MGASRYALTAQGRATLAALLDGKVCFRGDCVAKLQMS